jgi:hypothetical protein
MALNVWRACSVAAFVLAVLHPLDVGLSTPIRARVAREDTRAIASAIRAYVAHCGGLPAHDPGTDCPMAGAEAGGPYVVPVPNLHYWRQTNANGQIGGPFLTSWPTPPCYGAGVNDSYAYYILQGGTFVICSRGEGTGANSEGGRSCP